jgi:hypothetical protein
MPMPRRFHKHKLLLDENTSARQEYPRLNQHFDVKHIRDDLRQGGAIDEAVHSLAVTQGRIIVTANGRHFRRQVGPASPGVIDFPADWPDERLDTKLTALLMNHGPAYFKGQYRTLATE